MPNKKQQSRQRQLDTAMSALERKPAVEPPSPKQPVDAIKTAQKPKKSYPQLRATISPTSELTLFLIETTERLNTLAGSDITTPTSLFSQLIKDSEEMLLKAAKAKFLSS